MGHPEWIPVTMILLNVLGIALGTAAFAGLMDHENAVPWTPLLFFAWIGIAHALLYDLNEILALCLSLWALVFFFSRRLSSAGLLFGLAALGKDLAFSSRSQLWFISWQLEIGDPLSESEFYRSLPISLGRSFSESHCRIGLFKPRMHSSI